MQGKVAGPFLLSKDTCQVKIIQNGSVRYINPLVFAARHCTLKEKRRMKKGRRVTDLTGNGLNSQYSKEETTVNSLPSLHFLMCLLNDKEWMFTFDYCSAYRNVPYHLNSWGLVAFVFDGYGFIDLSLTFGYGRAALIMQNWSGAMRNSFNH